MMKLRSYEYVIIALTLGVQVSLVCGSCANGWVRHDTTCYHFSHDTETMFAASISCQQMGGTLAEIETPDENAYLVAKIREKIPFDYYWIGLNDIQEGTVWIWYGSKQQLSGYVNWNTGEPSNFKNDENCVALSRVCGKWHDNACHSFMRYICEASDTQYEIVG